MEQEILKKFTYHFRQVIYKAYRMAKSSPKKIITPEYLLWGLLQQKGSLAAELLKKFNLKVKLTSVTNYPVHSSPPNFEQTDLFPFSPEAQRVIERAVLTAAHYAHHYVGTEHLLASLLKSGDESIRSIFKLQNIPFAKLKEQVDIVLNSTSRFPELAESVGVRADGEQEEETELPQRSKPNASETPEYTDTEDSSEHAPQTPIKEKPSSRKKKSKTPALDFFANNLTTAEAQRRIDPVIGREKEIARIIQILGRRTKNNPILLGEPGVGKTAIIEGIAKRIWEGDVPEELAGKKIYSLDISLLVAGTIYRGEFESRIKQVIDEIKQDPSIILFIDEIHNIIGAGSSSGSLDAANILKPELARGTIRCIGATTYAEFKRYIENDTALERRFQPIHIQEVSPDEAKEILRGLRPSYERHHKIKISDEAIDAAVSLGIRFLPEKFLPDKAIDLIDEAASRMKMNAPRSPRAKEAHDLKRKIELMREQKQRAVAEENFPRALSLKEQEMKLAEKLEEVEQKREEEGYRAQITERDIITVLSDMTNIPVDQMTQWVRNKTILRLLPILKRGIIGQEEALREIAATLKRAHAGLAGHARPLGSFLFLGPSGVGKTEVAKVLAEALFGSRDALIRFDMSEFSESFNISKLIGAPAGYVGYHEGGKLTELIRRRPHSIILFDEIEKAHPDVFNILLQVLEDGHLMDASGKRVNFKNTIIILTSNIGLEQFNHDAAIGFSAEEDGEKSFSNTVTEVMEEMKQAFRPEFINRIDKIITFHPLSERHLRKIAAMQLDILKQRLSDQRLSLTWEKEVPAFIAREGFSPEEGARGIRKYVEETISDAIADFILKGKARSSRAVNIEIDAKNNTLMYCLNEPSS